MSLFLSRYPDEHDLLIIRDLDAAILRDTAKN